MRVIRLCCYEAKWGNLNLKSRTKQLLGSLLEDIAHPLIANFARAVTYAWKMFMKSTTGVSVIKHSSLSVTQRHNQLELVLIFGSKTSGQCSITSSVKIVPKSFDTTSYLSGAITLRSPFVRVGSWACLPILIWPDPLAYLAAASVKRKEGLSNDSAGDVKSSAPRPKHEHDGAGVIKLFFETH